MIQRMLSNLLDNGIKYTPPGGRVDVSVSENEQRHVLISIKDTGVGISESELPRIFERFYRGDQSRSQTGVGLGLSLARAIARAHGGDISVTSAPGQGSTFIVSLPRKTKECYVLSCTPSGRLVTGYHAYGVVTVSGSQDLSAFSSFNSHRNSATSSTLPFCNLRVIFPLTSSCRML